jgi:ribonucleoside-diphosphate reductase alpha chain
MSVSPLIIERVFTKDNYLRNDEFGINFVERTAHIIDSNGNVIFHMDNVIVPDFWSQTAVNILAQKYFRKTNVPLLWYDVAEQNIPFWASRRIPQKDTKFTGENDLRQVVSRLVGHWVYTGFKNGYFKDEIEAQIFQDELKYMLYHQIAAPNSPQWFNTGLYWAYGIEGNQNNDHWTRSFNEEPDINCNPFYPFYKVENSYQYPQIHACFINKVEDKLVGENGIMDLFAKEARIFKYGSGSGCNYSDIRGKGELLSGGGVSSGLLSFLKIGDTVGGAIKSGGTTRRASRMVLLNCDHPDILEFIDWKVKEEEKVQALVEGSKIIRTENVTFPEYTSHYEGEAYQTVSGQNSNNSIVITNHFMDSMIKDYEWLLKLRTNGANVKPIRAKVLFEKIAKAAWQCGDPGIFYKDTINEWNTCRNDEEIMACNPCAEYLWFSDTACNLASLNLLKFYQNKQFNIEQFVQACKLWTIVLDISIDMAGYPTYEIARKTFDYRTLGLGFTNLGALLMVSGYPYNSDRGRFFASDIASLMTATAYLTSAQLAERLTSFPRYEYNKEIMKEILDDHYICNVNPDSPICIKTKKTWSEILNEANSFRNAQVTVIAPTGTISLIMDCATTGIEPDYSLIKYKELSGGGTMKLVNGCTQEALANLGYGEWVPRILEYISENGTIDGCPLVDHSHYAIFDCASDITPLGHLLMVAAVQPFISGGISKTINLPNSATVEDIEKIYLEAWHNGVKCISIYRDGCKNSQPLTAKKKSFSKIKGKKVRNEHVVYHKITCEYCGSEQVIQTGTCAVCLSCGQGKGGCV